MTGRASAQNDLVSGRPLNRSRAKRDGTAVRRRSAGGEAERQAANRGPGAPRGGTVALAATISAKKDAHKGYPGDAGAVFTADSVASRSIQATLADSRLGSLHAADRALRGYRRRPRRQAAQRP